MSYPMLPLHQAGYREPSPLSDSYPYKPTYARVDALLRRAGGWAWARNMTNTDGHCGQ